LHDVKTERDVNHVKIFLIRCLEIDGILHRLGQADSDVESVLQNNKNNT
jgi:hypothetical protein